MKVVVAHNRYRSGNPSGENRVVDSEISLLRDSGVDVIPLIEDSDDLVDGSARAWTAAAMGPVRSSRGVRRLTAILAERRPDVVHLHNVFPLISPWVVRTAVGAGVPVVQTVHNYRHTCVAGVHLRDGAVCEDCRPTSVAWAAIRHGCYRGSRSQSALMAAGQATHRRTWPMVDRFLVSSPLMDRTLRSAGVPAASIEWRPTHAEDAGLTDPPLRGGVAFVGRLDQAKGVELLLQAWTPEVAQRWGQLVICGDGPLSHLVAARAGTDPSVEWLGLLGPGDVRSVMREAQLVAVPSLWFEGFPHVAAEAMSIGRPVLTWSGAGFSRLADSGAGWALESTPGTWSRHLLELDRSRVRVASGAAREFYDQWCSAAAATAQLLRTYEALVSRSGAQKA